MNHLSRAFINFTFPFPSRTNCTNFPPSGKKCENVSKKEKGGRGRKISIYKMYTLSQKRESIVVPPGRRLSAASNPPYFSLPMDYIYFSLDFTRVYALCAPGISHSKISVAPEVRLVKDGRST